MENSLVNERIANLKGRRSYEEKKALKLGFLSLQEYMEDKLQKERIEADLKANVKQPTITPKVKRSKKKTASSCGCCA